MSTAERRAKEKAQRRREILEAARDEFLERGIHRPTVDDVASRAQVSKGTIYLYFESKEEILAHLLLEGLDLLVSHLERACRWDPPPHPERALRSLAEAYLEYSRTFPFYYRLIMAFDRGRFQGSVSPDVYQQVLDQSMLGLALVARAVDLGIRQGVFAAADPWQAAGSVWAALNGVLVLSAHPMRRQMLASSAETMYEATFELVLRGLKHGPDGRSPIAGPGQAQTKEASQ